MRAQPRFRTPAALPFVAVLLALAACAGVPADHRVSLTLTGSEEVPPVTTPAGGSGSVTVAIDKTVTGRISTTGLEGVAAHIHQGARGQNGPVLIGLVKSVENVWMVPAGARLTDAQYAAFMAGNLYVNVHTPANKGGEIRAQLVP